jgi:hypothetical protein
MFNLPQGGIAGHCPSVQTYRDRLVAAEAIKLAVGVKASATLRAKQPEGQLVANRT